MARASLLRLHSVTQSYRRWVQEVQNIHDPCGTLFLQGPQHLLDMSNSLDTVASGIGIASFSIQVFDKIIQGEEFPKQMHKIKRNDLSATGYQFWSKVSAVPREHKHLLLRVRIEKNRLETFLQNTRIAELIAKTPSDALHDHELLMKEIIDEIENLLTEVNQRFEEHNRDPSGNIIWAAEQQKDLAKLANQLEYYNSQLLALLDPPEKEEQRRTLDVIQRSQIQAESNLQQLHQMHEALYLTPKVWIHEIDNERHKDAALLRKLAIKEREQQIQQQKYLCKLISIKEHLQSSLSQFDMGHVFEGVQELPFLDSMTAGQDLEPRSCCYDTSRQQWVEWQDREVMIKNNEVRIRLLVHLLQKRKPASFRSPICIGYVKRSFVDNTIQYGLVLAYPEQSLNAGLMARMSTLRDLLQEKNAQPSLSDRVSFCTVLARCIQDFHTVGWLHKGIRSKNVVFMVEENEAVKFDKPYLIGFGLARPDVLEGLTIRPKVPDNYEEIYRHPNAQFLGYSSGYRRSYDLFSLGIVFIEVIMWKPIEEILGWDLNSINQIKLRQVTDTLHKEQYSKRIAVVAGNSFAQVVDRCLRSDAIEIQAINESTIDLDMEILMSHKIVGPLEKLRTALSAT